MQELIDCSSFNEWEIEIRLLLLQRYTDAVCFNHLVMVGRQLVTIDCDRVKAGYQGPSQVKI